MRNCIPQIYIMSFFQKNQILKILTHMCQHNTIKIPLCEIEFRKRKGVPSIKSVCVAFEQGKTYATIVVKDYPNYTKDQVLVKVLYCGICGTDIKLIEGKYPIDEQLFPLTLGHEFVGEIVEVGSNIKDFKIGDYVAGKPTLKICGKCVYCKTGAINMCQNRLRLGINVDGAFTEYMSYPEEFLINANFLKEVKNGVWLEPISVVARGIHTLKINPTMRVAITGVGPIGVLTAMILKEYGVHLSIFGQDSDSDRLNYLKDLNIADYISTDNNIETMFDCVIDCSGNESAINNLFEWAKPGAQVLLLGTNRHPMNVHLSQISYKELKVTGTLGANEEDWIYAVQFLKNHEEILTNMLNIVPVDDALANFYTRNPYKIKNAISF